MTGYIIWFIGCLFSYGVFVASLEDKECGFSLYLLIIVVIVLVWPFTLGIIAGRIWLNYINEEEA